jgi:hypothetical protein
VTPYLRVTLLFAVVIQAGVVDASAVCWTIHRANQALILFENNVTWSGAVQIKCVLANLYSGQSSYVTTCRKCRQESRMSSEVSEYFELDLQVFLSRIEYKGLYKRCVA